MAFFLPLYVKHLKPILQLNEIVILLNLAYDSIILLKCSSHLDINLLHAFEEAHNIPDFVDGNSVKMRRKLSCIKL